MEYVNLPRTIGAVVSNSNTTLKDCQDFHSVEDIYIMLEILSIDAHNRRAVENFSMNKV